MDDHVPSILKVGFNILEVDSLLVYESGNADKEFTKIRKLDNAAILKKANSTGRNGNEERFVDVGILFDINRKYKLVFFSKEKQRSFIFSDFVIENYNTILEDGTEACFPMLRRSKINGLETNGNFILE